MHIQREQTGKVEASSASEVLLVFLRLGLTSFGGPVAHLGYFRDEFVSRRQWLDEAPTPISSRSASSCPARQAARSAWRSACAAGCLGAFRRLDRASRCLRRSRWCCSPTASQAIGGVAESGWLHGLKVVAVAVVAQAVWGMAVPRAGRERATLAVAAAVIVLAFADRARDRSLPIASARSPAARCCAAQQPPVKLPAAGRTAEPRARRA